MPRGEKRSKLSKNDLWIRRSQRGQVDGNRAPEKLYQHLEVLDGRDLGSESAQIKRLRRLWENDGQEVEDPDLTHASSTVDSHVAGSAAGGNFLEIGQSDFMTPVESRIGSVEPLENITEDLGFQSDASGGAIEELDEAELVGHFDIRDLDPSCRAHESFLIEAFKKTVGNHPNVWAFKVSDAEDSIDLLDGNDITTVTNLATYLQQTSRASEPVFNRLAQFLSKSTSKAAIVEWRDGQWTITTQGKKGPMEFAAEHAMGKLVSEISKERAEIQTSAASSRAFKSKPPVPSRHRVRRSDAIPELQETRLRRQKVLETESLAASAAGAPVAACTVVATPLTAGRIRTWTFEVYDKEDESLWGSRIKTVSVLRDVVSTLSGQNPPPKSMIDHFLGGLSKDRALEEKVTGYFSQLDGDWKIVAYGLKDKIQYRSGAREGEIIGTNPTFEDDTTEQPVANTPTVLGSWDIRTQWIGGTKSRQSGSWHYSLRGEQGIEPELMHKGQTGLRDALVATAVDSGIDNIVVGDGPPLTYCRAFGSSAGAGTGKCTLTENGAWTFRADRTVDGQEGSWEFGPGYGRGRFISNSDVAA